MQLVPWLACASMAADCPRCPRCLVPLASSGAQWTTLAPELAPCLPQSAWIRRHKDINGGHRTSNGSILVAPRDVWYCDQADTYFTHPPLSTAEIDILYLTYMGQAKKSRSIRRSDHQAAYIKGVLSLKRNTLPPIAVIVEAGCSWGALLTQFGGNGRTNVLSQVRVSCEKRTLGSIQQARRK